MSAAIYTSQQKANYFSPGGSDSTEAGASKVDPVEAVASDPEKLKQLLEKLLVQSVARGDTSVMEEIIRDVNNEEKKMARFVWFSGTFFHTTPCASPRLRT